MQKAVVEMPTTALNVLQQKRAGTKPALVGRGVHPKILNYPHL